MLKQAGVQLVKGKEEEKGWLKHESLSHMT